MKLALINLLAGAAMIVINGLAMFGKIGGITPQGVSERYPNVLTPAGWTFSIWSIIYILVMIFMIGSLVNANVRTRAEDIGNWFWISCLLNIGWILTWHFDLIFASMLMMLGLLTSLVMIISKTDEITLFNAGFSLYAGWITVATLANLMVMLVSFGADGFGKTAQGIALSMIVVAIMVFTAVLLIRHDWVYGTAGVIAFAGIAYRQLSASTGMLGGKYSLLAGVSVGGLAIILALTVFVLMKLKGGVGKVI